MKKVSLKVVGMSCAHCVNKVETALSGLQGVKKANVNLKKEMAKVKYDETVQSIDHMKKTVKETGYEANEIH
ncbi:MAG TPA: copper ion binding protein [Virgibacillus sp.]|nr:copper ion binding protein [Virgibacillus sp.]